MSIKVIGAGQPRTATHSLKKALEILGHGPCYHMFTLLEERPEEISYFVHARNGQEVDWDTLFKSYQSGVDFPIALFYLSLLKKYPDAKIILTVRDAEKWYESISETVFKASQPSPLKMVVTIISAIFSRNTRNRLPVLRYAGKMIKDFYGPDLHDKFSVIKKFEAWNSSVQKNVPASQLLVYDLTQGWGPLCTFLDVPVPNVPFPISNTRAEFKERAGKILNTPSAISVERMR